MFNDPLTREKSRGQSHGTVRGQVLGEGGGSFDGD